MAVAETGIRQNEAEKSREEDNVDHQISDDDRVLGQLKDAYEMAASSVEPMFVREGRRTGQDLRDVEWNDSEGMISQTRHATPPLAYCPAHQR